MRYADRVLGLTKSTLGKRGCSSCGAILHGVIAVGVSCAMSSAVAMSRGPVRVDIKRIDGQPAARIPESDDTGNEWVRLHIAGVGRATGPASPAVVYWVITVPDDVPPVYLKRGECVVFGQRSPGRRWRRRRSRSMSTNGTTLRSLRAVRVEPGYTRAIFACARSSAVGRARCYSTKTAILARGDDESLGCRGANYREFRFGAVELLPSLPALGAKYDVRARPSMTAMDSSRTCDPDSSASRTRPARRRGGRTTGRRVCRPMRSMVRLKRDECIAYRQSLDGADVLTPPKALDAGRGDYFAVVMPGCTEPGPVDGASFRVLDRAAGRVRIALPSQDDGQCASSR